MRSSAGEKGKKPLAWAAAAAGLLLAAGALFFLLRPGADAPIQPAATEAVAVGEAAAAREAASPSATSDTAGLLDLDGSPWAGGALAPEKTGGPRVRVTLDGLVLADLPFSEAHRLTVHGPAGINTVEITGTSVFMAEADCDNHDCIGMGEITRDNLDTRVLGGWIICLPHRVTVEVYEP